MFHDFYRYTKSPNHEKIKKKNKKFREKVTKPIRRSRTGATLALVRNSYKYSKFICIIVLKLVIFSLDFWSIFPQSRQKPPKTAIFCPISALFRIISVYYTIYKGKIGQFKSGH